MDEPRQPGPSFWRRLLYPLRLAGGVGLILLGIVGLVLPILQGILLIVLGLMLLAPNARFARWVRLKAHRLRRRWRRRHRSTARPRARSSDDPGRNS